MKKLINASSLVLCIFLLSACSGDLPKCGDKDSKELLSQIFNDALKSESLKFIQAKNFAEKGFNKDKEIRVCTADVMLSNGEEEEVTYNLYWQDKKKVMFMLEIVGY